MSFVERLVILCPYLGESTTGGSTVVAILKNAVSHSTIRQPL